MRSAEPNGRSVLHRAFLILDAFSPDTAELSLAELSRRTDVPKGTLHRLAAQLVHVGALERTRGGYQLGLHLFELARLVPAQRRLREAALPFMEDLYVATHETVHLGVLRDLEVVYIDRLAGHRQVYCPTRVGGRMPAHCTSLGKAMLAFADKETIAELLSGGLEALSPHTITVPGILLQQLARIRKTGVAFDNEEAVVGVVCVAAPVLQGEGAVAALSVTGPRSRLNLGQLAPAVRTAALGLSRALSAHSVVEQQW